jgi:hypothetical protein
VWFNATPASKGPKKIDGTHRSELAGHGDWLLKTM